MDDLEEIERNCYTCKYLKHYNYSTSTAHCNINGKKKYSNRCKEGQFSDSDKKTAENFCIDYMDVNDFVKTVEG